MAGITPEQLRGALEMRKKEGGRRPQKLRISNNFIDRAEETNRKSRELIAKLKKMMSEE
jgi:hypothetical protein